MKGKARSGTTAGQQQPKYKEEIWKWFSKLSLEERGNALLWEDREGTCLLKQMYKKKWAEGEGFFLSVDDPSVRNYNSLTRKNDPLLPPSENFCFTKFSNLDNYFCHPERVMRVDQKLEGAIRLCDTREYCDTLTVASELLKDTDKFLGVMEVVTRGGFLTSPVKVNWDEKASEWVWEEPSWFSGMGFYTLGTYVAHKLEQAVWRSYWQAHNLDPRKNPARPLAKGKGTRERMYNFSPNTQGLHSKRHLVNFWNSLAADERSRIVGKMGNIVEEVLIGDKRKEGKALDYRQPLCSLLDLLVTFLDEKAIEGYHFDYPTQILNRQADEPDFIEFVYFSPMHRAFEPLDLIVRRIGRCIQAGYTEKIAMDLILGEENDKRKRKGKAKGKQNKQNCNKTQLGRKGKKQDSGNQQRQTQKADSKQDRAKKSKDVNRYVTALVRSYLLDRVEAALVHYPFLVRELRLPNVVYQNEKALAAEGSPYIIPEAEAVPDSQTVNPSAPPKPSSSSTSSTSAPPSLTSSQNSLLLPLNALTQSAPTATPKKRKKRKSKGRSRSVILQREDLPEECIKLDEPKKTEEEPPKEEVKEEPVVGTGKKARRKNAKHHRGLSAEIGRSLDTVLEVAVTESAELIPVRRIPLRSSVGSLASDDTLVMKRRYSSPAHMTDNQPRSTASSGHASNSNSYCTTTDEDELSFTSESYYSTDEESGSIEDLASYHGSEIGSWHSSGESLINFLPQDLSLNASLIASQLNPRDIYYDIKSDDEYYSTFTVVSSRRKRNRNRQKAQEAEAETESETHSENEAEMEKEGETNGRGRGRRRKAVMKRSKSQECCSRKEVEKANPNATTPTNATPPKKVDDNGTSRAVRGTAKRASKSLNHEPATSKRSGPAVFREKVSGILNRSAPSFSAIVKGLTDSKSQKLEREKSAENERKDSESISTTKPTDKVMTYSEVVNRKESGSGIRANGSSVGLPVSPRHKDEPREERKEDDKRSATPTKGKEKVQDEDEPSDDRSRSYDEEDEDAEQDGTSQQHEVEPRIRPLPVPFTTNLSAYNGRMANSSPPSPSSHSSQPSTMINSLLPLTALSPPTSPDILQRRTRARARSQPPTKEVPIPPPQAPLPIPQFLHHRPQPYRQFQTTDSLMLDKQGQQRKVVESLPELQLADHLIYQRRQQFPHHYMRENGGETTYHTVNRYGYSHNRRSWQIIQEASERERRERERAKAERIGARSKQWRGAGVPPLPLSNGRPSPQSPQRAVTSVQQQAMRYARVSHLLTQSLSDVERVVFLHKEVEDYVNHIVALTDVRRVYQEEMIGKIRTIVTQLWSNSRVECYGSYATSLCIPSSDLDLVVLLSPSSTLLCGSKSVETNTSGANENLLRRDWTHMQIMVEELRKHDWVHSLQFIDTAKVPVIKLVTVAAGHTILTDITFSFSNSASSASPPYAAETLAELPHLRSNLSALEHSGIAASHLVRSYMRSLPALTPLALVLKQFLSERGLNNTYTGGLSSYCLVLMIVAFLRINKVPTVSVEQDSARLRRDTGGRGSPPPPSSSASAPGLKEEENLGAALLGFLRFFGLQFDFDKMGISLHNGGCYFYLAEPCNTLVIADPFNPERNIGHSVFGMWQVKAAFKHAFHALISPYTTNYAPTLLSRMLQGVPRDESGTSAVGRPVKPRTGSSTVREGSRADFVIPPWAPSHAAYLNLEFGSGEGPRRDVFPAGGSSGRVTGASAAPPPM